MMYSCLMNRATSWELQSMPKASPVIGLMKIASMIAVMSPAVGTRIMNEASERLLDAYARRRESLEKLGIPTDPEERVGFLMGKVGGTDIDDVIQVIRERKALVDGTHPRLHTYENWPGEFQRQWAAGKTQAAESRRTRLRRFIKRLLVGAGRGSESDPLTTDKRERLEAKWQELEQKRLASFSDQIEG